VVASKFSELVDAEVPGELGLAAALNAEAEMVSVVYEFVDRKVLFAVKQTEIVFLEGLERILELLESVDLIEIGHRHDGVHLDDLREDLVIRPAPIADLLGDDQEPADFTSAAG